MMQIVIKVNEEKLNSDDKLNTFYDALNQVFEQIGVKYVKNGSIIALHSDDNINYYANFGKIVNILKRKVWFIDNVTSWKLYESYNDNGEEKVSEEDLLARYKKV